VTWVVKPCVKYLSATAKGYRVQRPLRSDDSPLRNAGYETAFVHESKELCEKVAKLLNNHEQDQKVWLEVANQGFGIDPEYWRKPE